MYSALPVAFKNAAATLYEHPGGYVVFAYQPGSRQLDDLRAALHQLGHALRRRGWHRVVSDQRLMTPFTPEEHALIVPYWQQHAQEVGHGIHAAILLADDVFARLASNQLRHEARLAGITYRLFDQHDDAAADAWLRQQAQPPRLA